MKPFGEAGIMLKDSEYYINFPSEFAKKNLFYTEQGGHYHLNRHYVTSRPLSNFRYFSFQYVVRGEMLILIDGKEYLLHDNEIGVIDTSKAHLYAACKDTELLFVRFRGNHAPELVSRIHEYRHAYTPPNINRTHRALMEIAEGFIQQTPLYEEVISSHIHTILSDLLTLQHGSEAGRESVIDQSIHYIEANYYLPVTVQELAGMACLNASYFSEKFKSRTGVTPKQYLIQTRLNAAKILLRDTDWSIREIADKTGFQSDSYFTNYFHTQFHKTPTEYRNLKIHGI